MNMGDHGSFSMAGKWRMGFSLWNIQVLLVLYAEPQNECMNFERVSNEENMVGNKVENVILPRSRPE